MANKDAKADDGRIAYRSGVAARLAGLSAETLRVWERRYKLSETDRSPRGQRLYTVEQVRKLGLLKQLVDQGHAIGVLAGLTEDQLQGLLRTPAEQQDMKGPLRVGVIGGSLARRIAASGREGRDIVILYSSPQLEPAIAPPAESGVEVLLIEISELHESALSSILLARAACDAPAVVVLYRFAASATIRALREQGCLAARIPADVNELLPLCHAALAGERLAAPALLPVPQPRFDEDTLQTINATGNGVACECPKHLAEVLMVMGSFERYSAQCASRHEDDARLHQDLQMAAGHARAILETAMEQLARAEGLVLGRGGGF